MELVFHVLYYFYNTISGVEDEKNKQDTLCGRIPMTRTQSDGSLLTVVFFSNYYSLAPSLNLEYVQTTGNDKRNSLNYKAWELYFF